MITISSYIRSFDKAGH